MRLLVHIDIFKEINLSTKYEDSYYQKPLIEHIKSTYPQVIVYEFDNHSDSLVTAQVFPLVAQASHIALVINEKTEGNIQGLLKFTENILKNKSKCNICFLNTKNTLLMKLFMPLGNEKIYQHTDFAQQKNMLAEWVQTFPE